MKNPSKPQRESMDRFLIWFFLFRKNGGVFPNNSHGVCFSLLKRNSTWGGRLGVVHHLRKHPNMYQAVPWMILGTGNGFKRFAWETGNGSDIEGETFVLVFFFGLVFV